MLDEIPKGSEGWLVANGGGNSDAIALALADGLGRVGLDARGARTAHGVGCGDVVVSPNQVPLEHKGVEQVLDRGRVRIDVRERSSIGIQVIRAGVGEPAPESKPDRDWLS